MTKIEAVQYAIDWLRAFPVLPTAAPGYAERRDSAVKNLEDILIMLQKTKEERRCVTRSTRH